MKIRTAAQLAFDPDGEVLPVRYLWALLGSAAAWFVIGHMLSDDDSPNDLGGED